mgnify:CR=1 FL=1
MKETIEINEDKNTFNQSFHFKPIQNTTTIMDVDNILSIITGEDAKETYIGNANVNNNNNEKKKSVGNKKNRRKKKKVDDGKKKKEIQKKPKIPKRYRTLFGLIQEMIGCAVAVELKDDSIAEGLLYEVLYPSSDLTLTNVKYKRYLKLDEKNIAVYDEKNVETMYIKGPRIRYIIFPEYLNIKKILRKAEQRRLRAKNFYGRTTRK